VPLHDAPDARRLDLHASLRNPLGEQWLVRVAQRAQGGAGYAVADLSASMAYEGRFRKLDVLADFVEALAWSAWARGDAFGFVGCDEGVRRDLLLPLVRAQGAGGGLARRLRALEPRGRDGARPEGRHRLLRRERSLVFSSCPTFHLPLEDIERVLGSLARHEVVRWCCGIAPSSDRRRRHRTARAGDRRRERPATAAVAARLGARALARGLEARRDALEALFRRQRLRPLFLMDGFDADAVTAHFHR
jgi:hypothetical protein